MYILNIYMCLQSDKIDISPPSSIFINESQLLFRHENCLAVSMIL